MIRVGAHVPTAGGLRCAVEYAVSTGCETFQIFAKSPRRWAGPSIDPVAAADFRSACDASDVGPVFTHASYLINLGAESDELWERSIAGLADELVRASTLGAAGVVIHLGRRFSDDDGDCVGRVTECVVRATAVAGERCVPLLLENSAGAGRQFGVSVSEMSAALVSVRSAGVDAGLCFDTCHGFAGGIDVRTEAGWRTLLEELRAVTGPGAIRLIHANDCKGAFGSHLDRHEWIGDGAIGSAGFAAMLRQPDLATASVVVEMPGDPPVKDEVNVRRLKSLRDGDAGTDDRAPERA
jgi:deoxyribonuclease-4